VCIKYARIRESAFGEVGCGIRKNSDVGKSDSGATRFYKSIFGTGSVCVGKFPVLVRKSYNREDRVYSRRRGLKARFTPKTGISDYK
jgi:hypothetical protein